MGEIEIDAENAARVDVKPVAEPERGALVEPAEELLLGAQRRIGRNGLHARPWRTIAIAPPEIVVEV